jgi:hypothetical protein
VGDRYLQGLFMAGALALIRYVRIHGTHNALRGSAPDQKHAFDNALAQMVVLIGADGQGRTLQVIGRACRVNEIASDIRRDAKVGRANSTFAALVGASAMCSRHTGAPAGSTGSALRIIFLPMCHF